MSGVKVAIAKVKLLYGLGNETDDCDMLPVK